MLAAGAVATVAILVVDRAVELLCGLLVAEAPRALGAGRISPGIDLVIDTEQRLAQDVAAEILEAMRRRGMLGTH